jgi:hypothetical protein
MYISTSDMKVQNQWSFPMRNFKNASICETVNGMQRQVHLWIRLNDSLLMNDTVEGKIAWQISEKISLTKF